MKLVILTNILAPYRIPLFEEIARRVEDLTILLMAERHENREWVLPDHQLKVITLPGVHLQPPGHQVPLHANYGVIRILRRLRPDLVLSGGFAPANILSFIYCKCFGAKFVGWGEITLQDISAGSPLRRALRRWLIAQADGAVASSRVAEDAFLKSGADRERTLLSVMPIDVKFFWEKTQRFKSSAEYAEMRRSFVGPVLLSVGRVVKMKGYEELFRIYQLVLHTFPMACLLIVGDGSDRSAYEEFCQTNGWKNVSFAGYVQMKDLPRYLALGDLFIFHTLYDRFGAVLSEAMAAGLPVVSSIHAAATQDLIEEGVTGVSIDPVNAEASAKKVLEVLSMSPEERTRVGQAAHEKVRQYDIAATADAMTQFLETIHRSQS